MPVPPGECVVWCGTVRCGVGVTALQKESWWCTTLDASTETPSLGMFPRTRPHDFSDNSLLSPPHFIFTPPRILSIFKFSTQILKRSLSLFSPNYISIVLPVCFFVLFFSFHCPVQFESAYVAWYKSPATKCLLLQISANVLVLWWILCYSPRNGWERVKQSIYWYLSILYVINLLDCQSYHSLHKICLFSLLRCSQTSSDRRVIVFWSYLFFSSLFISASRWRQYYPPNNITPSIYTSFAAGKQFF